MQLQFSEFRDAINVVDDFGNEVTFIVNALYKSQQTASSGDVFGVINSFVNSELSQTDRVTLFNLYLAAKDVLVSPTTLNATCLKLEKIFGGIFELIDRERLSYFVAVHGGVGIPLGIKETWDDIDESFTRNKTYLKQDYRHLTVMCTVVKLLMPLWGEFVGITKDSIPDAQKEFRAYSLLARTDIMEYPAFDRLKKYVDEVFHDNLTKDVAATTVGGIGQEEIPEWLCASLIVRRLGLLNLKAMTVDNGPTNIISQVSSYIDQSIKNMGKRFSETIHAKKPSGGAAADGEKDPSYLETIRVKQVLPYGNIMASSVFLYRNLISFADVDDHTQELQGRDIESIYAAVKAIDPSVPDALIQQVIDISYGLETEAFAEHNIKLMLYCMAPAISMNLFEIFDKLAITHAMINSQILMHHWGLHCLALSVTGINLDNVANNLLSDRIEKPNIEHMALLDKLYPCKWTSKTKIAKLRSENVAYPEIMHLSNLLVKYKKAVRCPPFLTSKDVPVDKYGHMSVPSNISHELVRLLIKFDELSRVD